MATALPIGSIADCYAQALLVEREAAARCLEFAEFLDERGDTANAGLFHKLARNEARHADELVRRSAGLPLPPLSSWHFNWLDDAPPGQVSHELIFHLMTPYDALKIALGAERSAKALFERTAASAADAETRRLARELAQEESEHIGWIEEALAHTPKPLAFDENGAGLFAP